MHDIVQFVDNLFATHIKLVNQIFVLNFFKTEIGVIFLNLSF